MKPYMTAIKWLFGVWVVFSIGSMFLVDVAEKRANCGEQKPTFYESIKYIAVGPLMYPVLGIGISLGLFEKRRCGERRSAE